MCLNQSSNYKFINDFNALLLRHTLEPFFFNSPLIPLRQTTQMLFLASFLTYLNYLLIIPLNYSSVTYRDSIRQTEWVWRYTQEWRWATCVHEEKGSCSEPPTRGTGSGAKIPKNVKSFLSCSWPFLRCYDIGLNNMKLHLNWKEKLCE